MKRKLTLTLAATLLVTLAATAALAAKAVRAENAIWAHDELYDTVVTDTTFMSPPLHSTDVIYSFMMSGLTGQRSIAEAAPGDTDFNGGRWNVQLVTYTQAGLDEFDPDMDDVANYEITNAEDLEHAADMGLIMIAPANFYFECPMIPNRGR